MSNYTDDRKALIALVLAIESRYDGETEKRRSNAIGGAIEKALTEAKALLGKELPETENQKMRRELKELMQAAQSH
jgi:acyl-coenzyme A synthetase/AMP-(fatty) acid ligase